MSWNRRDIFKLMTGAAAFSAMGNPLDALAAPANKTAADKVGHPDAKKFASGDLLWPALPNTRIIYSKRARSPAAEEAKWAKERDEFLAEADIPDTDEGRALRERLQKMTYEEFTTFFMQDSTRKPGREKALRLPRLSVGHVAIVEIDKKGKKWIVEAMPKGEAGYRIVYGRFTDGVVRTPYSEWIKKHANYNIWHGRIKVKANRADIANAAKSFLGKDYWIWALNFADESAFYCSKLVWVSAHKALGIALDNDKTTSRQLWLSPKRLMKLDKVAMLYSPAPYGE